MIKTILFPIGVVALLWAAACFALWRWQEHMIFEPASISPEIVAELADVALEITTTDGKVLRGWEHPGNALSTPSDCKLLIYFGGNNEEVSLQLPENGARFYSPQWYINYRGFGQSEGAPTAESLRADALQIFEAARQQHNIAAADICVMGRSLGSHMAAHVAAHYPIKKLIMVTPFDSVLNVAKKRYPIFPVQTMLRHVFDTVAETKSISAPTLFLLAEFDSVVPIAHSENLIAHWQSPHSVVYLPGTAHNSVETPEYWRAIDHFLAHE